MRNSSFWSGDRPGGDPADAPAAVEVPLWAVALDGVLPRAGRWPGPAPDSGGGAGVGARAGPGAAGVQLPRGGSLGALACAAGAAGCAKLRGRRAGLLHGAAGSGADPDGVGGDRTAGQAEQGVQPESLDRRGDRRHRGGARSGGRLPALPSGARRRGPGPRLLAPLRDDQCCWHGLGAALRCRALRAGRQRIRSGPAVTAAGGRAGGPALCRLRRGGRRVCDRAVPARGGRPGVARRGAAERQPADVIRRRRGALHHAAADPHL